MVVEKQSSESATVPTILRTYRQADMTKGNMSHILPFPLSRLGPTTGQKESRHSELQAIREDFLKEVACAKKYLRCES